MCVFFFLINEQFLVIYLVSNFYSNFTLFKDGEIIFFIDTSHFLTKFSTL